MEEEGTRQEPMEQGGVNSDCEQPVVKKDEMREAAAKYDSTAIEQEGGELENAHDEQLAVMEKAEPKNSAKIDKEADKPPPVVKAEPKKGAKGEPKDAPRVLCEMELIRAKNIAEKELKLKELGLGQVMFLVLM
jgi:hypothetical protein